jgi:hypothetical protein
MAVHKFWVAKELNITSVLDKNTGIHKKLVAAYEQNAQ